MAGIVAKNADAAATKCTELLIDKVIKELPYMCCYKSYAADFEEEKEKFEAAVEAVNMKIKQAQKRNETQIDPIVEQWLQKANRLIQQEITPKKWFSRYSLAKQLESMTKEIQTMVDESKNFSQVAHAAERPGLEFYSQEFMHFMGRNSVFEKLKEELKDGNKCKIGLQAMGGSGKTTMAKEVGKELENSKAFDKVIFIEVPNPIDEKKIRDEIERKLDLKNDDDRKENLTQAEKIWIRIADAGKVLIILDDVWQVLNLQNIGIHRGIHTKGRCCVLLTTRDETVCKGMRCQETINLEALPEEDAVDLFLYHASVSGNDCPYKSKLLASKIVNECGKLPVKIVAVAKTFRNWVPNEWEDALAATKKDSSLRHGNIDEETKKFSNSLKRTFECLDKGAYDLILLCSIFPRAYEIPVELLSRIAIGLGLCGNVDSYYNARSQVLLFKTKLVSSALLLPTREGFVKMHDVIRDEAQKIADEKIKVFMDFVAKLEKNVKYSSWKIDDFSNDFEGNNLEVLLVWVKANASLDVPDAFFRGMKGLRVLLLCSNIQFRRTLALSLPKSIHPLENIQTLSLLNWELGDISILHNLKELQSLELTNCSILELPNEVSQLEKLRLLRLAGCSIKRNNPFEVIGKCPKLEVLYYVANDDTLHSNAKPSKIIDLQEFELYHIEGSFSRHCFQLDASTKRYFNSTKFHRVLSEGTVKSLAARAEILELTECNETRWTNLFPNMVHAKEDGGMNDLIKLSLKSWPAMQCLICTNGIPSGATIFSNLVELLLHDMPVRELCRGDFPIDFLKQLEKLNLSSCGKLDGTLFKGKLELRNLKFVELVDCSMTCLFHLSTAQSLRQLENLRIIRCSMLNCVISDDEIAEQKVDDHQDPNQKNHHSMFLKLKFLKVQECHELEFILPISPCEELESVKIYDCNKLNYIFGRCPNEGGLYQMEKEAILPLLTKIKIAKVPKLLNIYPEYYLSQPSQVQKSWGPMCCFSSKASARNIDEQSFSKANQLDHTQASKEKRLSRVGGLFTPPLYPFKNLRNMSIERFSELKSLLTLSMASSLKLLETLEVNNCDMLEHIITDEKPNSHGHKNVHSIFPNLQQVHVESCSDLQYVFPAFYSRDFTRLEHVFIQKAGKMKYVFGKCCADQDHNVQSELALPALKGLWLDDVLNMVSICTKNYSVKALSLQDIHLEKCSELPINSVMDLYVDVQKREDLSKRKEKGKQEYICLYVTKASKAKSDPSAAHAYFPPPLNQFKLRKIQLTGFSQLTSLFTISIASSMKLLETLEVEECDALQHIITDDGPNSHSRLTVHSFFPRLQEVSIRSCNNLEYVFPAFYSKNFEDLEDVSITKAKRMKYVFGKCCADQDPDVLSKLNFPALKRLYLDDVQNMVSICPENYYVEVLYLEDIDCEGCPQLPQTFIDFLFGEHKRQDLSMRKALSLKERGKPLSNLRELCDSRDICVEPKSFLSFQYLSWLKFAGCKQLQFILSASTARSMPDLRDLIILDCEELVSIIDNDEQNQQNPLDLHQACFPMLRRIKVKQCKKLKCLFSISTCPKLPKLLLLEIEDAPELVQVFEWKQGASQELVIKDVLPKLLGIRLVNLPSLHTIYQGIDFQALKVRLVGNCGNIPLANVSSSELFDFCTSLRPNQMNFVGNDYYVIRHIIYEWAEKRKREEELEKALERDKTISEQNNSTLNLEDSEEASKEANEKDSTIQKQESSSLNLTEIEEERSQDIANDSTVLQQKNSSPNIEKSKEVSKEIAKNDSTTHKQKSNLSNLTESIHASASEIVEEKLSTTLSSNSHVNTETSKNENVEEQLPTSKAAATPSSKYNRIEEEGSQQDIVNDSTMPQQNNDGSPKFENSEEVSKEIVAEDSTTNINLPNLTKSTITSANETVEEKLSTTPSSNLDMNLKATFGGPSSEKYGKASSSKESMDDDQQAHGERKSSNEAPQRIEEPTKEWSSKETSNEVSLKIPPPFVTEMTFALSSSICSPKKPQIETSTSHVEMESGSSQSDLLTISAITDESLQLQRERIMNQPESSTTKQGKFDLGNHQQFAEDDLMKLFQIMEEGAEMEVHMPHVSKIAAVHDDNELIKALADLEGSLKMSLNEIASSKESRFRLENALNILSSHCFEHGAPSHGLQTTILNLQQEIQNVLSSSKQAYATIDTFNKLEHQEKLFTEERSKRKEAAVALLSEIYNKESSLTEASLKEEELKEQISKLQAELDRKEKQVQEHEMELISLKEQKKKSVYDTMGFIKEFDAVKKERSHMVEENMKAKDHLQNMDFKWSSCLSNLKKTTLLLGVHLQQKL